MLHKALPQQNTHSKGPLSCWSWEKLQCLVFPLSCALWFPRSLRALSSPCSILVEYALSPTGIKDKFARWVSDGIRKFKFRGLSLTQSYKDNQGPRLRSVSFGCHPRPWPPHRASLRKWELSPSRASSSAVTLGKRVVRAE